jgi:hypothetical protein
MAGENEKTIHDYTDDELADLSTEELERLRGDHVADDEGGEGGEGGAAAAPAPAPAPAAELDEEALAALAAEGEGEGGSRMVPHARFEEVNRERRALLEEVLRLRNGGAAAAPAPAPAPAPPPYDFKAKRKEYHALLLEDPDKAAALLEEIEDARDQQFTRQLQEAEERGVQRATTAFKQQHTQDTAERAAERIYEAYPFLNHASKDANPTAIYAVIGQRDALIANGVDPVEAMRQASEEVGKQFAKLLGTGGAAPAPAPAPAAPNARKVDETRRIADAINRQPATPAGGIGNRVVDGTLDINNLTDEQLLKLPPEELAKLRGDTRIPA